MFVDAVLCTTVLADGSWTVTQVSDGNAYWLAQPAISGTSVVWVGYDGTYRQIYSNFGGQLTYGATDSFNPDVSGTNVVWAASEGVGVQVYSNFAGRLSDQTVSGNWNNNPAISGTNVVWGGVDPGNPWIGQIYSNFAGQLTHYTHIDGEPYIGAMRPDISGANVVWEEGTSGTNEHSVIYSNFGGPWASPSRWNLYPVVSGTNVVWMGLDDQGHQDFWSNFAGQLPGQVGPHSYAISGTNVVWAASDGLYTNFGGVIPTGIHPGGEVAISGTTVVWNGLVDLDSPDHEIYMATYTPDVVPLPGAVLLGILGLGAAGWKLRRSA